MSVNTYINGQLVRVSGSSTQTQSDAIQVAALPTPSAQYEGKVYQYIGNDTATEKHGLFYGCIEENSEYKWVQVNTDPDTEIISNEKLAAMWGTDLSVVDVQALNAMSNGTYNAPNGVAYNPVVVDVQEEAWEPLEDGYSNFWFELTNDTLSPWLNFSAKNNDAVIDWGDGSGEIALDTLTPTHTYSKAGKYIVKVKGATGVAQQTMTSYPEYYGCLRYVELNNDVTALGNSAFQQCINLRRCTMSNVSTVGNSVFLYCASLEDISISASVIPTLTLRFCFALKSIVLTNTVTLGTYNIQYALSLEELTLPSTITTISSSSISSCTSLKTIHCQAIIPPTLGQTNVFNNLPADFIIYVPAGYGNTYKAASGWSDYADHIVEES